MKWRRRRKGSPSGSRDRAANAEDLRHLEKWAGSRRGVEAFVEPQTAVTETTVLLVAHDGEWTRRRISSPDVARELGRKLTIPVYDAGIVGYPQRMRDWQRRHGGSSGRRSV